MSKDYYKILDIEKGASKDEIKKAFRKKAHQYHPDKEGGDEAKFKEVNEAYQVLSDDQKRAQYDQFGSGAFNGAGGFGGGQGFGGFQGGMNFEDLGDMFGDMFGFGGGSRGHGRQARGNDIQVDVQLTFKESVFGAEKDVQVSKNSTCERCGGNGAEPGTQLKTCDDCNGSGTKVTVQRTILGAMQSRTVCTSCHGQGEIPEQACTTCHGDGVEYKKRTLRISIPAGVETGMRIRVRGEGEAIGAAGMPGDLYVMVHVTSDKRFRREGEKIYSQVDIGFTQAALGDEIQVDTVDGKVKLKIPAGTQAGNKLRIRGKGVQTNRGRGDHIVIVNVETPKKLSREQKKLLKDLDLRV